MRVFFRFLGSLYFALFLIGATLLFVIAGTLLESATGSHLFAAGLTYQNPLFQLLLWLYFVNILISALNRYPFQKRHIPFLLTHLGLLLLLFGVFVKNHLGVQGSCALTEGSSSSTLFLPNTFALHLENPSSYVGIPLKQGKLGPLETGNQDLKLTLLEWTPHVEEQIEGFIKKGWVHLVGLPPFPLTGVGGAAAYQTPDYQIYGYKEKREVSFPGKAALFFMPNCLVAFNDKGERFEAPLNQETLYIYDKGYGGYAAMLSLPAQFPQLELIAPLTRSWKEKPLPQKREEAIPRLRLLASCGDLSEIVTLAYDKYAQKFKWPILGGKYLIRFQSERKKLPSSVRLLKAEQINYPGTEQPYSYEASLRIDQEEVFLSMNHVYEKKGYRYYLANLIASPSGIKQIQLVVNYDPAKYLLTYPGALVLVLGIILLYLRKHYA